MLRDGILYLSVGNSVEVAVEYQLLPPQAHALLKSNSPIYYTYLKSDLLKHIYTHTGVYIYIYLTEFTVFGYGLWPSVLRPISLREHVLRELRPHFSR